MKEREQLIDSYIKSYNAFDVPGMVRDFAADIVFQNIQNGSVTLTLEGLEAFVQQAELAKGFFAERKQTVLSYTHQADKTEVVIEYYAVLATNLPNGMRQGEEISLRGRSIFEFRDNKIVRLTDIS